MSKILVLSTVHHFDDNRILFKEIESIKKNYQDITYAVQYPSNNIQEYNGVKLFPLTIQKSLIKRFFSTHSKVYKLIKKERYDVIHFHDPELIFLMFVVKLMYKSKVIFDIHENIGKSIRDKQWIPFYFRRLVSFLYIILENIIISKFDVLIVAESSYKKKYGEHVIEILNYPRCLPSNKNLKKDFTKSLNFVYTGEITKSRGIWVMLNIFELILEKNQDVHLDLVGRFTPSDLETDVTQYIKRKKLQDFISIHGRVSINRVNSILKKSHVGFSILEPIDNYLESLPTKIFDYMNNKVVVVASDFPLYKQYVDKSETGITVDFYNYKKSMDNLFDLISRPEQLTRFSENGYELIKTKWNWEGQEKKLLNIYDALLTSR